MKEHGSTGHVTVPETTRSLAGNGDGKTGSVRSS